MLTDTALRILKPKSKTYKASDRDGMYVMVDRDILPVFENRQLNEITADDLRALCNKVKACGAPATAVHVRDIVKQVYAFAILHGEKLDNPGRLRGHGFDRDLRAQVLGAVNDRDLPDESADETGGQAPDHSTGAAHDSADAGTKERTDRDDMRRN